MNDLSVIGDRSGTLAKLSDTARTLAAASLSANTRRALLAAAKSADKWRTVEPASSGLRCR